MAQEILQRVVLDPGTVRGVQRPPIIENDTKSLPDFPNYTPDLKCRPGPLQFRRYARPHPRRANLPLVSERKLTFTERCKQSQSLDDTLDLVGRSYRMNAADIGVICLI